MNQTPVRAELDYSSIDHRPKLLGCIAAVLFPGMFLALGLSQRGYISIAAWLFFIIVTTSITSRIAVEHSIISLPVAAVAFVSAVQQKPLEAEHVYSASYRFRAADGKEHLGRSGWLGEPLPAPGESLLVLYRRDRADRNLPICDFRFYDVDLRMGTD